MTDRAPLLVFRSAGRPFALPVGAVREVAPMPALRPLPGASRRVAGLMDLRGELVTVLALHEGNGATGTRAGRPASPAIIVVESAGELLGIAVDAAPDIRMVSQRDLAPPPAAPGLPVTAVVNLEDDLPLLLDPDRLLPAEEDPPDA